MTQRAKAAEANSKWGGEFYLAAGRAAVDACVGVGALRRRDGDALLAVWRLNGPSSARRFFDELTSGAA